MGAERRLRLVASQVRRWKSGQSPNDSVHGYEICPVKCLKQLGDVSVLPSFPVDPHRGHGLLLRLQARREATDQLVRPLARARCTNERGWTRSHPLVSRITSPVSNHSTKGLVSTFGSKH